MYSVHTYYADNNNQLRKSGTTLFQNSEQPVLLWYISSLPSAIKLYIMQRYIVHVDLCKYGGPLNKIEQKWTVKKFTTVAFKSFLIKYWLDMQVFVSLICFF